MISLTQCIAIPNGEDKDIFMKFDPFKDVRIAQFVTMSSSNEKKISDIPLFWERYWH